MKGLIRILVVLGCAILGFAAEPVPDFRLPDLNTNSPRQGAMVSPRDYTLQVSAYYFGEAH